jgi:putative FmdB family regulatory protein
MAGYGGISEGGAVPIYEYHCMKCGETFEAFQKITDKPLAECRYCRGKVEKLISQSSFQLKGSGWYLTDYARKSQPSSKPASTEGTKSGEGKEGAKRDKAASTPAKQEKSSS